MIFEYIKLIGGVFSSIIAIIAGVALFLNPVRNVLRRYFTENKAQLAMLRNNITEIYYEYLESESLPVYIKENLVLLNNAYVESGGNAYIQSIVKDMLTWEVLKF
jgi:ribosomal protein L10